MRRAPALVVCVVAALAASLVACGSDDTQVDLDGADAATADSGDGIDATLADEGGGDDGGDATTDGDGSPDPIDAAPGDGGTAGDASDGSDARDAGAVDGDAAPRDASPCPDGQTLCDAVCTNLESDETSCGRCGHACEAGSSCTAGSCEETCGAGLTACDGGCAELGEDPENCGACGMVCPVHAHETAVCAARACAEVCATGYADCDLKTTDGCEAHLTTDAKNCGLCGRLCPANDRCAAAKCVHE